MNRTNHCPRKALRTRSAVPVLLFIFALSITSCSKNTVETSAGSDTPSVPSAASRINREAAGICGIAPRTADCSDLSAAGIFETITDRSNTDAVSGGTDRSDDISGNTGGGDDISETIGNGALSENSGSEPLPGDPDFRVHGIYVTATVTGTSRMEELIRLADETDINAFVIDIKDDRGNITYQMATPTVERAGSSVTYISDIESLIAECKAHHIYLIARIVSFKDPCLAAAMPEYALHEADGTLYRDNSGQAWLNPYNREVWDYLMEIAKEAARIGFDEIQFDYIRFSTDRGMERVVFGEDSEEVSKSDVINAFTRYARETLAPLSVTVSADVYGTIIDSTWDQQIVGQNYAMMARELDVICPMVYPSHYGPGVYRVPIPDTDPYRTVTGALNASRAVLDQYGHDTIFSVLQDGMPVTTRVRPWLQAFTATWVSGHIEYGRDEIQAQVQAVRDAGYDEWIFWNASVKYDQDWF